MQVAAGRREFLSITQQPPAKVALASPSAIGFALKALLEATTRSINDTHYRLAANIKCDFDHFVAQTQLITGATIIRKQATGSAPALSGQPILASLIDGDAAAIADDDSLSTVLEQCWAWEKQQHSHPTGRSYRDLLPDILEYSGEFGTEIAVFLPFIEWASQNGLLKERTLVTYAGMECFYDHMDIRNKIYVKRPRGWIRPNQRPAWLPRRNEHGFEGLGYCRDHQYPNFRHKYAQRHLLIDTIIESKPLVIIHNKYTTEWGAAPINFINTEALDLLFSELKSNYTVVYIRHGLYTPPADYSEDHNSLISAFGDLAILKQHPDVYNFDELLDAARLNDPALSTNEFKCILYSRCTRFISSQGGGTYLNLLFPNSDLVILHRKGDETKWAYKSGFYSFPGSAISELTVVKSPKDLVVKARSWSKQANSTTIPLSYNSSPIMKPNMRRELFKQQNPELSCILEEHTGGIVYYFPNPGNAGDALIAAATYQLFDDYRIKYVLYSASSPPSQSTVVIGGGGNLIPIYNDVAKVISQAVAHNNRIVILPHSIKGHSDTLKLLKSGDTIFVREKESLERLTSLNLPCTTFLSHDLALYIDPVRLELDARKVDLNLEGLLDKTLQNTARCGIDQIAAEHIYCIRKEREKTVAPPPVNYDISDIFSLGKYRNVSPRHSPVAAWLMIAFCSKPASITTNRLHVAISCALAGTPANLLDNSYGKISSVFKHSLQGHYPNIRWSETAPGASQDSGVSSATPLVNTASSAAPDPALTETTRAVLTALKTDGLTYLSEQQLRELYSCVANIERHKTKGALIEIGPGMGGSTLAIALAKSPKRPLKIYDTFESVPPPTERDGREASDRYRDISSGKAAGLAGSKYYGYITDRDILIRSQMERLKIPNHIDSCSYYKGLVENTLNARANVAFAHIDVTWYEPTLVSLRRLFPKLVSGGVIAVTGARNWSGIRAALATFLAEHADRATVVDRSAIRFITKN